MEFLLYCAVAVGNGALSVINKMVNVRAGQALGTANGAIINYIEATILSLLLIFLLGDGGQLLPAHVAQVPLWCYVGGACGVIAMLGQIVATQHTGAIVSTVLILAGQMGMALVLDFIFFGQFSAWKVLGIFLILCGIALRERLTIPEPADPTE